MLARLFTVAARKSITRSTSSREIKNRANGLLNKNRVIQNDQRKSGTRAMVWWYMEHERLSLKPSTTPEKTDIGGGWVAAITGISAVSLFFSSFNNKDADAVDVEQ